MKKIAKKVTNLQKRKPKNTNLDQKSSQKSSNPPIFIVRKWPPKGGQLITLEVAKLITLERPKSGQTNNSPAYIYIHIYIYVYMYTHQYTTHEKHASFIKGMVGHFWTH